MKRSYVFALVVAVSAGCLEALGCSPCYPPSFIGSLNDDRFDEHLSIPSELVLIAQEYGLADTNTYRDDCRSLQELERADITTKTGRDATDPLVEKYLAFADAVRNGQTNAVAPELPAEFREFVLYLQGVQETIADEKCTSPKAWKALLELAPDQRRYRTVWVFYMLGNLAYRDKQAEPAAEQYQACRKAVREGFHDSSGLAHNSFRKEFFIQTNAARRIHAGLQAIAYYHRRNDTQHYEQCVMRMKRDMKKGRTEAPLLEQVARDDLPSLETIALYNTKSSGFAENLSLLPPLKVSPRLAWALYRNGDIAGAEANLTQSEQNDMLSVWLRFRLAQRQGRTDEAIAWLREWMSELQKSQRLFFCFDQDSHCRQQVYPITVTYGGLGVLQVTKGDLLAALDSFVKAGAYADAALIAERYLDLATLKEYVDSWSEKQRKSKCVHTRYSRMQPDMREDIRYILARRLARDGDYKEAIPYYPPKQKKLVQRFLKQRRLGQDVNDLNINERAAHLYCAARIMRWRGMELIGTALAPDYSCVDGSYDGIGMDEMLAGADMANRYNTTAPEPNLRFHYRHKAAEMAADAAALTDVDDMRAMLLWSAGEFVENNYPQQADVYYKDLARIKDQPLAEAAEAKRWFPSATPEMKNIHRSEDYFSPEEVIAAVQHYGCDTNMLPVQGVHKD